MANLRAEQRQAQILDSASYLARDGALYDITVDDVAASVGVSRATVIHYFTSMQGLRDAIVETAIGAVDLNIIAQAIAAKDPLTELLDVDVRQQAALSLAN